MGKLSKVLFQPDAQIQALLFRSAVPESPPQRPQSLGVGRELEGKKFWDRQ